MDDKIFRISRNPVMAKSLIEMAKERFRDVDENSKTYKVIEEYYEIIKELITSLMYLEGCKTLSHKSLIRYLEENYKEINQSEIILIDGLRKLRNNIVYYGQKIEGDYLVNNENDIVFIIKKLIKISELKID